jgi:hypothetical protein
VCNKCVNEDGFSGVKFLACLYLLLSVMAFVSGLVDSKVILYGNSPCDEVTQGLGYAFPTYKLGCMVGRD